MVRVTGFLNRLITGISIARRAAYFKMIERGYRPFRLGVPCTNQTWRAIIETVFTLLTTGGRDWRSADFDHYLA